MSAVPASSHVSEPVHLKPRDVPLVVSMQTALVLALGMALLIVHATFRGREADLDAHAYLDWYKAASQIPLEQFWAELLSSGWYFEAIAPHSYEVGFAAFAWSLARLGASNEVFFFSVATLSLGLKYLPILRLSPYPLLGLTWYVSWYYVLLELNAIRAGVATGFVMLAALALLTGHHRRYLVYVLLGATFHLSALLGLLLPVLQRQYLGRLQLLMLLAGGIGVGFLDLTEVIGAAGGLFARIAEYHQLLIDEGAYKEINRFNVVSVARMGVALLLIWKFPVLAVRDNAVAFGIRCFVVAIVFYQAFSSFPVVAGRASQFIGVLDLVAIPAIAWLVRPRIAGIAAVIVICAVQFYAVVFYSGLADFFYFWGDPRLAIP